MDVSNCTIVRFDDFIRHLLYVDDIYSMLGISYAIKTTDAYVNGIDNPNPYTTLNFIASTFSDMWLFYILDDAPVPACVGAFIFQSIFDPIINRREPVGVFNITAKHPFDMSTLFPKIQHAIDLELKKYHNI